MTYFFPKLFIFSRLQLQWLQYIWHHFTILTVATIFGEGAALGDWPQGMP